MSFTPLDDFGPAKCDMCGEFVPGWAKEYHLGECAGAAKETVAYNATDSAKLIVPMLRETCGGDEISLRQLVMAIYRQVFSLNPTTKDGSLAS